MQVRRRFRRLKRLAYLGGITGTVIAFRRSRSRSSVTPPTLGPAASWPPLVVADEPVAAVGRIADPPQPHTDAPTHAAPSEARSDQWVEPVDGLCPVGHPIKAKDSSRIYHAPGGRFYDRTVPERCYVDEAAAEADGYRGAKGS